MTATTAPAPGSAVSLWRPAPARLARLLAGLTVFGVGEAFVVASGLGNSPWTVFAEGVSVTTPLTIGAATILTGVVILAAWVPLGVRLGLGTVLNVVVIGLALDGTLALLARPSGLVARALLLLAGVAIVGIGSGLYLGTALGPGPRDGLMTGLQRLTGRPISLVRGLIELAALAVGWVLGGTAGVGTLAFALLIGPAVQAGLALDGRLRRQ